MPWICPTFQRPERLAELAISWDRHQHGKELFVRLEGAKHHVLVVIGDRVVRKIKGVNINIVGSQFAPEPVKICFHFRFSGRLGLG